MKFAVIGGGSWGTALANMLAGNGQDTTLWVREPALLSDILTNRENSTYLSGVKLDERLKASGDLAEVMEGAECFLMAVPCQFFRGVLKQMREHLPKGPVICCANKGIELDTLSTVSQVVAETLGDLDPVFAMLSGPSFALEVAHMKPTAVSLGCENEEVASRLQEAFSNDFFRVYTNTDYRGVELGGAVKNVIAIAAGIADGLGFGTNARAALITRGIAEMSRLGKAMGAKQSTFMGLAGMGDLVLTCTGDLSRNRQVGLRLGKGQKLHDILGQMRMVAEGVKTTEALHHLGEKLGVELPITEQVYAVLYEDKDPAEAVRELMTRGLKQE